MNERFHTIIIGGGFYGCVLALHLRRQGARVLLLERSAQLLERASWCNQARVHNGYHYPRSVTTALRSRVNYPVFLHDWADCVDTRSTMLYAVASVQSKVTAGQFGNFCARIGASLLPATPAQRRLFNPDLVEAVFQVEEAVFNAALLRARLREQLDAAGVVLRLECSARCIAPAARGGLEVSWESPATAGRTGARRIFNCTYSRINRLLVDSGVAPIQLRHELTEMAVVSVPEALRGCGVTVMCGPYFSLMPFPALGLHTLSHVRYTPHGEWSDREGAPVRDPYALLEGAVKETAFERMRRDAARYLPLLAECEHMDSLWEVKTILPRSDEDDSRPILYLESTELPGLVNVLGAKIDNVSDMMELVDQQAQDIPDL